MDFVTFLFYLFTTLVPHFLLLLGPNMSRLACLRRDRLKRQERLKVPSRQTFHLLDVDDQIFEISPKSALQQVN